MRFLKAAGFFVGLALMGQVPYTTVKDTLVSGLGGRPVNGSIAIQWLQFQYGPATIAASPINGYVMPIANGLINVSLVPVDNALAPQCYKVTMTLPQQGLVSYWRVPTLPSSPCASPSFCTVAEVTVAPANYTATCVSSTVGGAISWGALTAAEWSALSSAQWGSLSR